MLITTILLSLMLFALGGVFTGTYRTVGSEISDAWHEKRKLSNVQNWLKRHFSDLCDKDGGIVDQLMKDRDNMSNDENAARRLHSLAVLRVQRILLSNFECIEAWNPKDGRKPSLLGKKEKQALKKGAENDYRTGGISPYRLHQISYGIGKRYVKKHGYEWRLEAIDVESYFDDDSEADTVTKDFFSELFDIAKEYHAELEKARNEREKSKKSESESVDDSDSTDDDGVENVDTEFVESEYKPLELLDMLEAKEIKSTDIETPETLESMREHANGGIKGAITKQLNKVQ